MDSKIADEILKLLENKEMYIREIARALGISRVTADKYITYLEAKGLIKTEKIGYVKVCKVIK